MSINLSLLKQLRTSEPPMQSAKTDTFIQLNRKPGSNNLSAILYLQEHLPEILDEFNLHSLIGKGGFGSVFMASLKADEDIPYDRRNKYAIKYLHNNNESQLIKSEVHFLKKFQGCTNIVYFYHFYAKRNNFAVVTEFLPTQDFRKYFHKLTPHEVQEYMRNLLIALQHLHSQNVVHRDVKPENFLYDRHTGKYMLIDFGLTHYSKIKAFIYGGTPGYIAPECIMDCDGVTNVVDIWGAGVIFVVLLSGVYPFFVACEMGLDLLEVAAVLGKKEVLETAKLLDIFPEVNDILQQSDTEKLCLQRLCLLFRYYNELYSDTLLNRFSSERCEKCDQIFYACLCSNSDYAAVYTELHDSFPSSAYELLERMLEVNPYQRINAQQALEHEFFREKLSNDERISDISSCSRKSFRHGILEALGPKFANITKVFLGLPSDYTRNT